MLKQSKIGYFLLLMVMISLPKRALSSCCYSLTSQNLNPGTYQSNIQAASSNVITDHQMILQFPSSYITVLNNSTLAQCTQTGQEYNCTIENNASFMFTITAPSDPTATVTIDGASCADDAVCSGPTTSSVIPPDDNSGKINLGALGYVSQSVFWSVLSVVLVTLLGVAFLVYRRNHTSKNVGDDEESMIRSNNTSGWFGEKAGPASGTASGYSLQTRKAGQKTPVFAESLSRTKSQKEKEAKLKANEKKKERGSGRKKLIEQIDVETVGHAESNTTSSRPKRAGGSSPGKSGRRKAAGATGAIRTSSGDDLKDDDGDDDKPIGINTNSETKKKKPRPKTMDEFAMVGSGIGSGGENEKDGDDDDEPLKVGKSKSKKSGHRSVSANLSDESKKSSRSDKKETENERKVRKQRKERRERPQKPLLEFE